jgi:hypothetical protein
VIELVPLLPKFRDDAEEQALPRRADVRLVIWRLLCVRNCARMLVTIAEQIEWTAAGPRPRIDEIEAAMAGHEWFRKVGFNRWNLTADGKLKR